MNITFTPKALDQFMELVAFDRKLAAKVHHLIENICRHPFEGTGKPEPLRHELSGYWSRRINQQHRLVYRIKDDALIIEQCMFHYDE